MSLYLLIFSIIADQLHSMDYNWIESSEVEITKFPKDTKIMMSWMRM